MSPTVAALAPVFALIALGFLLKTFVFRSDAFWEPVEKLTYYVLFPALLVVSMAQARVSGTVVVPIVCILAAVVLAIFGVLAALRPALRLDGAAFSSVVQGCVRFNTYVGLAAAAAVYGRPGTTLLAIVLALMIPLSNILSVLALTRHAGVGAPSLRGTLVELAVNPLIIASVVGLALSLTATPLPPFAAPVLDSLGRAALALGLLAVGAGLNLGSIASGGVALVLSTRAEADRFAAARLGRLPPDRPRPARDQHRRAVRGPAARPVRLRARAPARRRLRTDGRHHHRAHDPRGGHSAARSFPAGLSRPIGRAGLPRESPKASCRSAAPPQRPPLVQEDFHRPPHRDPTGDQKAFADDVGNRSAPGEQELPDQQARRQEGQADDQRVAPVLPQEAKVAGRRLRADSRSSGGSTAARVPMAGAASSSRGR